MKLLTSNFGRITARRAMALVAVAALFYLAAGGAFLHEHKSGGNDTPCHVCQSLHLPALTPASALSLEIPEFYSLYVSRAAGGSPCEGLSLDRAGRAPPVA